MIRHIVLWRFKPEAKREGRIIELARIEAAVKAMRAGVPGLLHAELGVNRAVSSDAADLLLESTFSSWEALAQYEQHPLHTALRELIGPLRSERRVVDYER